MPRLSPLLAKPVEIAPLWFVERVARTIFAGVLNGHPDLFDRLGDYLQQLQKKEKKRGRKK